MHLRRLEWVACSLAFIVGAILPAGVFSGEAGRLLTTFLGLVAASILPTISLIVGGMIVGGRSVQHLGDLGDELGATVDALFGIFGLIALTVVVLLALAVPTPFADRIPEQVRFAPSLVGQGLVCFFGALTVARSGAIPSAIRKSLQLRTKIAVDEARKKTMERADAAGKKTASGFATRDGFGETTALSDLKGKDGETGDAPKDKSTKG